MDAEIHMLPLSPLKSISALKMHHSVTRPSILKYIIGRWRQFSSL